MLKSIILVLTTCSSGYAAPVGFSLGNDLVAAPIQGQVQVTCTGFNGNSSAVYTCRDIALDPQAYDFFVGPQDGYADTVELTAIHEDGSSRTKTEDYDGRSGKSRSPLNLWISTIFQKPLLEYGRNIVRYRLYASGRSAETSRGDQFVVTVKRGTARSCPLAHYNSTDVNDCNSQYSICQKYFAEYRNCR